MDVKHDVSDDDRQPDRADDAARKRQAKEDDETRRVRGPQRPAEDHQAQSAPVAPEPEPVAPVSVPAYRRRDLQAAPPYAPVAPVHVAAVEPAVPGPDKAS